MCVRGISICRSKYAISTNPNLIREASAVQRRGVRVTVVSSIKTQPVMIADELRRQADVFTDLVDLKAAIGRDPAERSARSAA